MIALIDGIANVSPLSLAIVGITIVAILYGLPRLIIQSGIRKLGPIELEHKNQTTSYNTTKLIDEIDTDNRETLWEMTEELFDEIAYSSTLGCSSAVASIIATIASPVRTMVLLNHIAPKLSKANEKDLIDKLLRGVHKSLRHAKAHLRPSSCPVDAMIKSLDVEKYRQVILNWIATARKITAEACRKKIAVYEHTLQGTTDAYWKNVYKELIAKNKQYIQDMEV